MSNDAYGSDALDDLDNANLPQKAEAAPYTPEELQQYMDGEITLGELYSLTEDDAYEIAEIGYSQFQQGKYAEAFKIFAGLQSANPNDPYFVLMLASIYGKTDRQAEAARGYAAVLELEPENLAALTSLAELQLNNGMFAEALENLGKVAKLDPNQESPHAVRAYALGQAAHKFLEAIVQSPDAEA